MIRRFLNGKATEAEKHFLDAYEAYADKQPDITDSYSADKKEQLSAQMLEVVRRKTAATIPFARLRSTRWIAAASILVVLATGIILYQTNKTNSPRVAVNPVPEDRPPASSSAQLTLADGSRVNLDSNGLAVLPNQGNVNLSYKNGQLEYRGSSNANLYNTISTPRGATYEVTLADGTKVWLNAASALRYPVAFAGNERSVTLSGEAYFEVARNQVPFKVIANGKSEVEVLGTHFNVNAYPDESVVATTLLEGKVRVAVLVNDQPEKQSTLLLSPGQQAVTTAGKNQLKKEADLNSVMAWKSGKFYFENEKLETIMKEFSRWYDVEVVYQGNDELKNRRFFMIVDRKLPLREVLKSLENSGVQFQIENKKLIIR
ncbi:FecR family protein [Pseudobacter ginsenosidimutans]|uniref:FecR family protein n=2 Tax=Pseudobacter ginsenosidimutans TaxID=661488 RepID=A0A4Q7N1I0_9BACT|nr:FecR family protein [Pseudobacter ginsenosidimutans]RZS75477.1 FecR family protein [Pseudobacter ginsenosidimutans]